MKETDRSVKVKVIKSDARLYKRISAGSNRSINIFLRMVPRKKVSEESIKEAGH